MALLFSPILLCLDQSCYARHAAVAQVYVVVVADLVQSMSGRKVFDYKSTEFFPMLVQTCLLYSGLTHMIFRFLVLLLFGWEFIHILVVVVVTRSQPLSKDGGVAEDHGAPEARQLPRNWTRSRKKTESR